MAMQSDRQPGILRSIDWWTIIIYVALLSFGWVIVCGAIYTYGETDLFSLSDRCSFFSGDLYEAVPDGTVPFDIIVSNPPYIRERDMESLMPEVRLYEPERALLGGEDGLCFYRRIIKGSDAFLKVNGSIFLEIGYDEGEDVSNLLKESGFSDIRIIKDLSALDGVICAKKRI